jgi:hypothetical protein
MGKRQRRRGRGSAETGKAANAATSDYRDPEGNVLTLRASLSAGTIAKLREPVAPAAASGDDVWRRRAEMLFERLAVRWVIADLPLSEQKELLARYRIADEQTQQWVRRTIDEHVRLVQVADDQL